MRLVVISDTHTQHKKLELPQGDVLIHCGDFCGEGLEDETEFFALWFEMQSFEHKIVIAGNHDKSLSGPRRKLMRQLFSNVTYLEDSGTEIDGIKFWGSPWSKTTKIMIPWTFHDYDYKLDKYWNMIPEDTDVLITHGPPHMILDRDSDIGLNLGSYTLMARIRQIKPKLNLFGHVHEGYGYRQQDGIDFINASSCDRHTWLNNDPVVWDI